MAPVSASLHVVIGNCLGLFFCLLFSFILSFLDSVCSFFFYFRYFHQFFFFFLLPLFSISVIDLITGCWPCGPCHALSQQSSSCDVMSEGLWRLAIGEQEGLSFMSTRHSMIEFLSVEINAKAALLVWHLGIRVKTFAKLSLIIPRKAK